MSEVDLEQGDTDLATLADLHHWNYRVVKQGDQFAIHELHYTAEGDVAAMTETPAYPGGDSLDDLKDAIALYVAAIDKPVFDADSYRLELTEKLNNDVT